MRTVSASNAVRQLSRLLSRVEAGQEIVITRRGKAIARLVPARPPKLDARKRAAGLRKMAKLMEKGLPLGGRRFTRDEMHED